MAAADDIGPDAIRPAVRIVPKGVNGTVRLSIDFDGAQPPDQLFADLEMIGWNVAAMPPPPREAIDWSTPDPATGQRFTLSSWQVVGFVVEPPPGSARGGAWAAEETRPFIAALDGVLRRHGLDDRRRNPPELADPPSSESHPRRPDTGQARGADAERPRTGRGLRRGGDVTSRPAPLPTVASIGVPDGLDPVRLIAAVPDGRVVERIELALGTIGVHARVATVVQNITESYRASTYERTEARLLLDMSMPRSSVVAVIAILNEFDIVPAYDTARFIEFDQALGGATASTPILAAVQPPDDVPMAVISLLLDPARRILVEDELDGLPALEVTWSKTTRVVEERFRGSTYERSVATLRLQVWVPPDEVRTIAPVLADAAGVAMDDAGAFEIQTPGRTTDWVDASDVTEAGQPTGSLRTA